MCRRPPIARAAAKPKEKDMVILLILVHEITISICDVLEQSGPKPKALGAGPLFFHPVTRVGGAHRSDSRMIEGNLLWSDDKGVIQLDDVRVVVGIIEAVSGPITAQCKYFSTFTLLELLRRRTVEKLRLHLSTFFWL